MIEYLYFLDGVQIGQGKKTTIPRVGDKVALASVLYKVLEVIWYEDDSEELFYVEIDLEAVKSWVF